MVCPRCNSKWDQNKSACARCGLTIRARSQPAPAAKPFIATQNNEPSPPREPSIIKQAPRISPLDNDESGAPAQPSNRLPLAAHSLAGLVPETPRLSTFFEPDAEQNFQRSRPLRVKLYTPSSPSQTEAPDAGTPLPVDSGHTHSGSSPNRGGHPSTETLKWNFDAQPLQSPPRTAAAQPGIDPSTRRPPAAQSPPRTRPLNSQPASAQSLQPGTTLLAGRYRLLERQGIQEWLFGAFEAAWLAQDVRRAGALVRICELRLPDSTSVVARSTIRSATMALHTISRHAHVPALWEVFNEQERSFFVFDHQEGESLLARMRRSGRVLPVQEVIECCLQVTDVLEFLLQLSPPLAHGLIRPEYIMEGRAGARYVLTNFSVVLAGGATQFVTGIERSRLSVYASPEFARGVIDVRSDIYALLASAYYLVTGKAPLKSNGVIPPARQFNPNIPPQFEAILARGLFSGKGLRPVTTGRYQHPSELRQDLLMMHVISEAPTVGTNQPREEVKQAQAPVKLQPREEVKQKPTERKPRPREEVKRAAPARPRSEAPVQASHPILQALAPDMDIEEPVMLLPQPEELPPLVESNNAQKALLYLIAMLLCLTIVIIVGRGLM